MSATFTTRRLFRLGRENPSVRRRRVRPSTALLDQCGRGGTCVCPGRKPKDACGSPNRGFSTPRSPGSEENMRANPVLFICCVLAAGFALFMLIFHFPKNGMAGQIQIHPEIQANNNEPWTILSANGGTQPSCNQSNDTPQDFITMAVQYHWGEHAVVLERDENNQPVAIEIDTSAPGPTGSMYFFRTQRFCIAYLVKMQNQQKEQLDKALNEAQ